MTRAARGIAVMTLSVALMTAAGVVYLRGEREPSLQSNRGAPSWNGTCPTTQLVMTGAFVGCDVITQTESCPRTFDQPKVLRMRGTQHDFLLYIELIGSYHGPGTYQLKPWPHPGLGENDGVPKVAVREYDSGQFWQSVSGWLRIDPGIAGGSLSAGFGKDPVLAQGEGSPVQIDLNVAGPWRCV